MTTETATDQRLDDLAQIIATYNQVTENLRRSHESLKGEVVRLQQELASTDAQLQRSKRLAALGEMAAGIAHEIRNPLGAIMLYADMLVQDLEAGSSGAMMVDTARKISSAVKGLDAIVNDVLSFSREIDPRPQPLGVEEVFVRAIEAVRMPRINVVMPEDGSIVMEADATLLHQVVVNLLRNAVDAMPAGGTLTLGTRHDPDNDDQVILTVRDTGPGIDDEAIDRIFNPFFTTRNTGTGLGLAIVHRIVDAHRGAITVHNDGGAVFEIRLPINSPVRCGVEV
jgi:signal transduction histidine kinase